MSEVFRALEQAEHDRLVARQGVPAPVEASTDPTPRASDPETAGRGSRRVDRPIEERLAPREMDDRLVSLVMPASFEAEQYRALAHTIERAHATAGVGVVAVSSATPGDGKTLTAINLAGALAQVPDARVLVVDADVRHPSLTRTLGSPGDGPGLAGAVSDGAITLASAVRAHAPFRLAFLPSGALPSAPWELVKAPRFKALIAEARRLYDYVILDTPPLVGVPDCRIIAESVDAFLVVVMAHQTSRRLLAESLTVIDPGKILGLVFNGDDRPLAPSVAYAYAGLGVAPRRRWAAAIGRARRMVPGLRLARRDDHEPWR